MALVFAIMRKFIWICFYFYIVSVHSFFIFFFNLVSINETEWSTIPAMPSFMCSFNRGIIEGTNSLKMCLMFVYTYVLCLLLWLVLQTDLTVGWYIIMWEEFRNVYLLMTWVWLSWSDPVWLTGHENPVTTTTTPLQWGWTVSCKQVCHYWGTQAHHYREHENKLWKDTMSLAILQADLQWQLGLNIACSPQALSNSKAHGKINISAII